MFPPKPPVRTTPREPCIGLPTWVPALELRTPAPLRSTVGAALLALAVEDVVDAGACDVVAVF